MRRAIFEAEVGDDVYHDDPTVLALEARAAEILGKENAMFTPTGTMANQTALRAHTSPGDVVLASKDAHIDLHELGAANAISGLTIQQLVPRRRCLTFPMHKVLMECPEKTLDDVTLGDDPRQTPPVRTHDG